jgi:hypothetical protein
MSTAPSSPRDAHDAPRAYAFEHAKVYVLPDEHDDHDGAHVGYVERRAGDGIEVDTVAVDVDTIDALEDAAIYVATAARTDTAAWVRDASRPN